MCKVQGKLCGVCCLLPRFQGSGDQTQAVRPVWHAPVEPFCQPLSIYFYKYHFPVCLSIFFNQTRNKEIHVSLRHFRPHKGTILTIYKVGLPSIVMQSIGSVMTFGMNKILLMFSSTAAAVFGVYFKLQSFIFMPVFGLNNGMVPIAGL